MVDKIIAPVNRVKLFTCDKETPGQYLEDFLRSVEKRLDCICQEQLRSGRYSVAHYYAKVENATLDKPVEFVQAALVPPVAAWRRKIPELEETYHRTFKRAVEKVGDLLFVVRVTIDMQAYRDSITLEPPAR